MGKKLTTKEFVEKAIDVHGMRYDYSKVEYKGSRSPVIIICVEHGEFTQLAYNHLSGKGCLECGKVKVGYERRSSIDRFIEKAIDVHGDRYDYSKAEYGGAKSKIKIICSKHGEFLQTPINHIGNKQGCPKCGALKGALNCRSNLESFIDKARKIHRDRYDYSDTHYELARDNIRIICPIHGHFHQLPSNHLRGHGCPGCKDSGFKLDRPAILYYLSIDEGKAFKIGITNRSVEQRYSKMDRDKITVLEIIHFDVGLDAYMIEQSLLDKFNEFKYNGPPLLESGNTELFKMDIRNCSNG